MIFKSKHCPLCKNKSTIFIFNKFDDRYGFKRYFKIVKCNNCLHKFVLNDLTPKDLKNLYSNFYPRSSFTIADYKPLKPLNNKFLTWLNGDNGAHLHVPKNVRVLDIGCGFGESVGYHLNRNCEVYGVEADSNIKKVIQHYGFNIKNGLFNFKDYERNFFDYVTMDQVLEHMLNPVKTLNDISKILKPFGVVIINIPNSESWGTKFFRTKWIHWHTPYHLQHFSKNSISLAAKIAGYDLCQIKTFTCSNWIYYQWMSLIAYPNYGKKSIFWENNIRNMSKFSLKFWCFAFIKIIHQTKINHLITRVFDFFGLGDNLQVILKKKN